MTKRVPFLVFHCLCTACWQFWNSCRRRRHSRCDCQIHYRSQNKTASYETIVHCCFSVKGGTLASQKTRQITDWHRATRWPDSSTRSIPPVPTKWFNSITRASPIDCTVGGLVQFNVLPFQAARWNTCKHHFDWDVVSNQWTADASSCGCIHKGIDVARASSWIQGKWLVIWHIVANTRLLQIRSGQVAL